MTKFRVYYFELVLEILFKILYFKYLVLEVLCPTLLSGLFRPAVFDSSGAARG